MSRSYRLTPEARAPGFTGPITATIQSKDGETFVTGRISGVTQVWKQYDVTLTTARSRRSPRRASC